jgi:hypothetical protein
MATSMVLDAIEQSIWTRYQPIAGKRWGLAELNSRMISRACCAGNPHTVLFLSSLISNQAGR